MKKFAGVRRGTRFSGGRRDTRFSAMVRWGAQGHTLFCTGTHAFLGDAEGHTLFRSYLSADTSNRGLSLEIGKNRIRFAFLGDIP